MALSQKSLKRFKVFPERRAAEREFFIDNLLVRIHFIIEMIRWTGLASWKFEFAFPGSLTSTFLAGPLTSCVGENPYLAHVRAYCRVLGGGGFL